MPFGQIVSRIARGIDPAEAFAPPVVEDIGTTEDAEAATGDDEEEQAVGETDESVTAESAVTAPAVESGDAIVADLLDELVEEEEESA